MKILFFDGICNLCNEVVWFVLPRLKNQDLYFASLQSESAKTHLKNTEYENEVINQTSLILKNEAKLSSRSDAALQVAKMMKFPWSLFSTLRFIPKPIRDSIYLFISKNRYTLFGKRAECRIPTEKEKKRFLP